MIRGSNLCVTEATIHFNSPKAKTEMSFPYAAKSTSKNKPSFSKITSETHLKRAIFVSKVDGSLSLWQPQMKFQSNEARI